MHHIKHLSNVELLEYFLAITRRKDPGPKVSDAIEDIENAGEDMTTELVKKSRKIVIRYLEKYMQGEEGEIPEEDEEYYEQEPFGIAEGKRRRKGRKSRSSKKGRRIRKVRSSKKGRKGRRTRRSRK
jgi:hypothetical protein